MSKLKLAFVLCVSAMSSLSFASTGESKAFQCMDEQTFAVNSKCMSQKIESNLVFKQAEQTIIANADYSSDRALATMTFDAKTMSINIVAHKDATLAKVNKQ